MERAVIVSRVTVKAPFSGYHVSRRNSRPALISYNRYRCVGAIIGDMTTLIAATMIVAAPCYRIDSFNVPESARAEFVAAMHRNMVFIKTLPGFRGHTVYEKRDGSSPYTIVTVAMWDDQASLTAAKDKVFAYYKEIGFDMAATLERWGVVMLRADYATPPELQ